MSSVHAAPRLMRQGRPDFSVGVKLQTIWGLREGAVFAVEGIAATLMLLAAPALWMPGIVLSELAMIGAVALLFSHLGNPRAAWRAIVNIRRSWISRGTAVISAFVGLGALTVLNLIIMLPSPLLAVITVLLMAAAAFILFYPGFAMAASAGIPFWNTGLLPILSALSGLASGGALALPFAASLAPAWLPVSAAPIAELVLIAALAIGLVALLSAAHRMGRAARLSGRRLITHERVWFWALAIGAGLLVPGAIALLAMNAGASLSLLLVGAALRIVGDIALRFSILKVGAYEAVL